MTIKKSLIFITYFYYLESTYATNSTSSSDSRFSFDTNTINDYDEQKINSLQLQQYLLQKLLLLLLNQHQAQLLFEEEQQCRLIMFQQEAKKQNQVKKQKQLYDLIMLKQEKLLLQQIQLKQRNQLYYYNYKYLQFVLQINLQDQFQQLQHQEELNQLQHRQLEHLKHLRHIEKKIPYKLQLNLQIIRDNLLQSIGYLNKVNFNSLFFSTTPK